MLKTLDLTKKYQDTTALDALNLTVEAGEIYCLLGANGAGKTTTINLLLNFIQPDRGKAFIKGLNVAENPLETKRHVAYIPEQVNLYKNLTGLENLEYFTSLAGKSDYTPGDLRRFLLDAGLQAAAIDRRVSGYSKGMRQKVGIALATAKRAEVLLLDEPTSGLDPQASNEFSELLTKLSGEGVAILMATHDLFRAKETGSRVGIMKHGRLVAEMTTDEIGHADLEKIYLEHIRE
jgi:ABC-2 type transport system ATP-binding protein